MRKRKPIFIIRSVKCLKRLRINLRKKIGNVPKKVAALALIGKTAFQILLIVITPKQTYSCSVLVLSLIILLIFDINQLI